MNAAAAVPCASPCNLILWVQYSYQDPFSYILLNFALFFL